MHIDEITQVAVAGIDLGSKTTRLASAQQRLDDVGETGAGAIRSL
jgi:hypothetical protein